MTSASESFDREVLVSKITCKFNWKLIYENLRDVIHARFLHPQTLTQDILIEPDPLPADHAELMRRTPHMSEFSSGGPIHTLIRDATPAYGPKVERWGDTDAYFNWLLFPNTHVVSPNGGYCFSIEHHHPVGPDTTEITVYYMTAKAKGAMPGSVLWEHLQAAKRVLDEDHQAMEEVQKSVGHGPRTAVLGAGEHEIGALQNWIIAYVGQGN
jgi:phenylpropionate dioxygenase-like ring-hydroxylating dioxygenase large terminal subunit